MNSSVLIITYLLARGIDVQVSLVIFQVSQRIIFIVLVKVGRFERKGVAINFLIQLRSYLWLLHIKEKLDYRIRIMFEYVISVEASKF